jgi:hypothetical protein
MPGLEELDWTPLSTGELIAQVEVLVARARHASVEIRNAIRTPGNQVGADLTPVLENASQRAKLLTGEVQKQMLSAALAAVLRRHSTAPIRLEIAEAGTVQRGSAWFRIKFAPPRGRERTVYLTRDLPDADVRLFSGGGSAGATSPRGVNYRSSESDEQTSPGEGNRRLYTVEAQSWEEAPARVKRALEETLADLGAFDLIGKSDEK